MASAIYINTRVRNLIAFVLASALVAIGILTLVTAALFIDKPFPGFLATRINVVSAIKLPEWTSYAPDKLKTSDRIIEVNGKPITNNYELYSIVKNKASGTPVTYTVIRGLDESNKVYVTIPTVDFTLRDFLMCAVPWVFVGFVLALTGLIIFILKPNAPANRAALLFFTMTSLGYVQAQEFYTSDLITLLTIITATITPSAFLILALYFPVEIKQRKYFWAYLLIITPIFGIVRSYFYYSSNAHLFQASLMVLLFHSGVLGIIALFLMFYHTIKSKDKLVRKKVKVFLYGSVFSLTITAGHIIWISYFGANINHFLWIGCLLVIPTSLGYSIAKHNAFDADVFIRRSVSYILVTGIVVALFFGLIGVSSIVLQSATGQTSGPFSNVVAVFLTILMMVIFRPLRDRIDREIDRRFYRERYEYRQTINKASDVLINIIELDKLLNEILKTVINAIKIERGCILLKENDPEYYQLTTSNGYNGHGSLEPLLPENPLIRHLKSSHKPMQLNDIVELDEFREHRKTMIETMENLKVVLVIPVPYEQDLIGVLCLGEKMSGAWYSTEDMELLQTLMRQTAVSIENARKVEELKKMVELEASYRELKHLDEMKDHFLSMVSHDLRTPMTSIKGYTSIMLDKLGKLDESRQEKYLKTISKESDRLIRLVSDLLDLQRLQAGRMDFELNDFDLIPLIEEAVDSFQGAAYTKNQVMETHFPDRKIILNADRDRMSQVIANLLSNAIKFTPEGGRVDVSIDIIKDNSGKTMAKVSVSDSGPGIPEEYQAKLFDKFQQAPQGGKNQVKGSGLGLALVKEIVEHQNGEVGLVSEPGNGSTFYFALPANAEKSE